jgi:UDP-N-acetylmuramyl pentapeptide phosphotransferase/UDP-N-acetylglucosamine-1-phosphate transferase
MQEKYNRFVTGTVKLLSLFGAAFFFAISFDDSEGTFYEGFVRIELLLIAIFLVLTSITMMCWNIMNLIEKEKDK